MNSSSRILGGLYGSLIGDALGVPVEFSSRSACKANPVTGMRANGMHYQRAGTWSDDGSLLLCSVESLVEKGFDVEDMGKRMLRWFDLGHWAAHGLVFDIGNATRVALDRISLGTSAEQSGGRGVHDNGNGSIMRILPVVLDGLGLDEEAFCHRIERASAITHAHERSKMACVFFGMMVRALMGGLYPQNALNQAQACFAGRYERSSEFSHFAQVMKNDLAQEFEHEIESSGYVIDTLTASIWCLLTTNSFSECVLKAVNLGDDTDTTGCVAGGLAGVFYGVEAIPANWFAALPRKSDLTMLFQGFLGKNMDVKNELLPTHFSDTHLFASPSESIRDAQLQVLQADITQLDVDAIVNAANSSLLGGGGVDGAIHRAAGPDLLAECRLLNGCRTGEAKMTKGHRLKARHIIHTVGPIWNGGKNGEADKLRACYTNSLRLAAEAGLQSIAFPCISTGVYRYPADDAAAIAVRTVSQFMENPSSIQRVIFCCFSDPDRRCYETPIGGSTTQP
jgi:ADP-ribosyl-[dinitrogen reductase] hydrolase